MRVATTENGLGVFVDEHVLAELAARGVALVSVFLDREGYSLHRAWGPEHAFLEGGRLRFTYLGELVEARVLEPEELLREGLLRALGR